jgi:hypothetical protein
VAENINKDADVQGRVCSWLGPIQQPDDFTLSNGDMSLNPEQRFGMVWVLRDLNTDTNKWPLSDLEPINRDSTGGGPYWTPQGNGPQAGAHFARPASPHSGMFIAAFCEGNAREVRQDIDYKVYQQLMTPDGQKAAYATNPNAYFEKVLTIDKRFMTRPLSPSDY